MPGEQDDQLLLSRLKPFITNRVIRRTRLEGVLKALKWASPEHRRRAEQVLARADIGVEEDGPAGDGPADSPDESQGRVDEGGLTIEGEPDLGEVAEAAALAAARRRLRLDRRIKNPAKVLLKPEEEVGLALLIRGSSRKPLESGEFGRLTGEARAAADCLLLHNQGLVHKVAGRYAPPGMTYDDLFQHGIVGLIRGVEMFNPALGYKFSTYAMNWIRQAITRGIANESRLIRLPVHMVERVNKVWATRSRLTVDGQPPTVHQLALACELTDTEVAECLKIGPQNMLSLDMPVGSDGEATLGDLVDSFDAGPEHEIEIEQLKDLLESVLHTLSEREAGVIMRRFGLIDDEPWTLEQIGQFYGLTRERIRQIETKTMDKLRHPSRKQVLEQFLYGGGSRPNPCPDSTEDPGSD